MRTSKLLRDLELGSDVAESDEHLRRYFVQTNVFLDVIHDETDLVLGPKGSGKTAIFRMLSDPRFEIPALEGVTVIPAFNTQGTVFFQDLQEMESLSEGQIRVLWSGYILSLIGNRFVTDHPENSYSLEVSALLKEYDLYSLDAEPRRIWKGLMGTIRRLMEPRSIQGKVNLAPGGPGIEGKAEYPDASVTPLKSTPTWHAQDFDSDRLARCLVDALGSTCERTWVVFDRLDEAFQDNSIFERLALRGLMRAAADLGSYDATLRVKLFLRTDVLDRITENKGFVNITHFRTLRISWTRAHIKNLILRRLADSDLYLEYLQLRGIADKDHALHALMSSVDETPRKNKTKVIKTGPLAYMLEKTVDSTREYNPRNVVSFLREARGFELQRCELNDPLLDSRTTAPISQDSMVRAWRRVSERRLVDTLFAEYNSLRPTIEKFRNGPQYFDLTYLVRILGEVGGDAEVERLVSELSYAGFFHLTGKRLYKVADLYRPALGLNPARKDHSRDVAAAEGLAKGRTDSATSGRNVPRQASQRQRVRRRVWTERAGST